MSNWQRRFVTANKKLKEIDPLVTELQKQLGMLRRTLKHRKDESIELTLNAAMANLKQIKKVISSRYRD